MQRLKPVFFAVGPSPPYNLKSRERRAAKGPASRKKLSSPRTWFTKRPNTSLTLFLLTGNPALDHGRALDSQVDLADQGGAVLQLQALFSLHHLHPFSGKSIYAFSDLSRQCMFTL